ncbi:MAG TPA: hypothetical protein ACFYEK_14300 [Candidatus Wunengus sp. YC60]|uniref:hypothetical protein n=1 Tax=Candidatus Wunengus sp. YC60 TaxID=3367697 RepID=UPI004024F9E4
MPMCRIPSRCVNGRFDHFADSGKNLPASASDCEISGTNLVVEGPEHVGNEALRLLRLVWVVRCYGLDELVTIHVRHIAQVLPADRNKTVGKIELPYLVKQVGWL